MMKPIHKLKNFGIGLCLAGTAAGIAALQPLSKGSCAGACAQCGSCGLTAIPLILWLAAKKWPPAKAMRRLLIRQSGNSQRFLSTVCSPEDKAI